MPETARTAATDILESFPGRYREYWGRGMGAKLGILDPHEEGDALFDDLLALLHAQRGDFTLFFRALSSAVLERPGSRAGALCRSFRVHRLGRALAGATRDPRIRARGHRPGDEPGQP